MGLFSYRTVQEGGWFCCLRLLRFGQPQTKSTIPCVSGESVSMSTGKRLCYPHRLKGHSETKKPCFENTQDELPFTLYLHSGTKSLLQGVAAGGTGALHKMKSSKGPTIPPNKQQ
ncbi:hypothetical protein CRENBAI_025341 [Crenichthys baileyi]|uniref:Uncharacterized protein n=1 Tax=Crenichthys baileyi TaxID=28760 RepID=A0AAV9S307_9TELE